MPAAFASTASTASTNATRTGRNVLIRLGFIFGLIFLTPAFVMQLAFDQVNFQFTSSRALQAANIFCTLYGIAMIATSAQSLDVVRRCRPALYLVAVALLSSFWSFDPASTFRGSYVLLTTTLFALAMASRLSPTACIQTIVQALVLICVLSIVWVFLFPQDAVHQATDRIQFQHAGLWRGVMSHKQGLGVISGLATGFLLFYGSTVFSSPIITLAALASGLACLFGSGSVTGLITAMLLSAMLYITYWIALSPPQARKGGLAVLVGTIAVAYGGFHFGLLDFVMPLFGKSTDLTGRAGEWPWVVTNINSNGALLGGGFSSGWEAFWAPTISIDNGYIEMLGSFGYIGAALVLSVYVWALGAGFKLMTSAKRAAHIAVFPFNVMFIELFLNVTEASFMTKSINTILICAAMCHITMWRNVGTARTAGARQPKRRYVGG
jgi:O-antigen ligase